MRTGVCVPSLEVSAIMKRPSVMWLAFSPGAETCLCICPAVFFLSGCIYWQKRKRLRPAISGYFCFRGPRNPLVTEDEVYFSFNTFVLHIWAAHLIHHIFFFSHFLAVFIFRVHFQMAAIYLQIQTEEFLIPAKFLPFPFHRSWCPPLSLSSSSPVPDGDDAFPASRQHRPSACGLVPVHLLRLLCQPSSSRLPVQLPARHWGVGCSDLWWVVLLWRWKCSNQWNWHLSQQIICLKRSKTSWKHGNEVPVITTRGNLKRLV